MEGHKTASPRPKKGTKRRKLLRFVERAGRGYRGYWLEEGKQIKGRVFAVDPPGDPAADHAAQLAAHNDAVAHKSARLPRGGARARVTIGQAAEMVRKRMADDGRKPGTVKWFNDQVAALGKGFDLNAPLMSIDVHDVHRFIKQRQVGSKASIDGRFRSDGAPRVSAETIRKHLTALHRIFEVARTEGVPVPYPNPVKVARKPPRPERVEPSYFTWEQLQGCLGDIRASKARSADADADLIEFAFATGGMRRGEIARCMREDLGETKLKIRGKKRGRSIPVCPQLRALVVRMLDRSPGDSLLPGATETRRTGVVKRAFKRWAERFGMPHLRCHTIRHSVRPHLDQHGVIQVVKDFVTGHRRAGAADGYDHATHPKVRVAFERLWQAPPDHLSQNDGSEPL